jgi:hypothetical protein
VASVAEKKVPPGKSKKYRWMSVEKSSLRDTVNNCWLRAVSFPFTENRYRKLVPVAIRVV